MTTYLDVDLATATPYENSVVDLASQARCIRTESVAHADENQRRHAIALIRMRETGSIFVPAHTGTIGRDPAALAALLVWPLPAVSS